MKKGDVLREFDMYLEYGGYPEMEFMLKYCISNTSSYLSLSKLHKVIHNYLEVSKKILLFTGKTSQKRFLFFLL